MLPIGYSQLKSYQRQRLESFVNPSVDPLGTGYNALQATIAVGSGKFIGRGLGQGTQSHLRFLPERHTDFIFASLVEELGFVGGVIVIVSYLWLSLSLMRFARYASSDVGSIICLTTSSLLLVQAFINIGMNMGLLPITGITLPLVSSGGSSILSFAVLLGLCYSVALRQTGKRAVLEIS
jgi:rod shape determining protein RodA